MFAKKGVIAVGSDADIVNLNTEKNALSRSTLTHECPTLHVIIKKDDHTIKQDEPQFLKSVTCANI